MNEYNAGRQYNAGRHIPFLLRLECLGEWLCVGFDVIPLVPFSRCGSIGERLGATELDTVYENQLSIC